MIFWSRGLGRRKCLVMDIGSEEITVDDEVRLAGKVREPVNWDYSIRLEADDWDDFFAVALKPQLAVFLGRRERLGELAQLASFLARFLGAYLAAMFRPAGR
ncbi:MAG: hypothetical protein H8E45_05985 [Proteobacteria bacterium]|nr:hypothetical protein [Pseudomonadota bacterium]